MPGDSGMRRTSRVRCRSRRCWAHRSHSTHAFTKCAARQDSSDPRVQDAYSLRCMPQVHGPVADAIEFAQSLVARELNAATDNPLVFENGELLSGGNFHGQAVALALDFLAIAQRNSRRWSSGA